MTDKPLPGWPINGQARKRAIEQDINPIENGVQQVYQEIRSAIELILTPLEDTGDMPQAQYLLRDLDDAIANNWDDLMMSFWQGVKQDIDLLEEEA